MLVAAGRKAGDGRLTLRRRPEERRRGETRILRWGSAGGARGLQAALLLRLASAGSPPVSKWN